MKHKIYYKLVGQGPPLVFVHGLLGFWRNFYSAVRVFSEQYTCLLYDQRGHGRSFHQEPYTIEQLAEDLKELCETFHWDKIFLVGHSLGAYVALRFSYKYPQYVKKLVTVDTSPWPQEEMGEKIAQLILNLPSSFPNMEKAKAFFKQSIEKRALSKPMAEFLMASLERKSSAEVKFLFDRQGMLKLLLSVRKEEGPSMLENLKVPALLLRGENSQHFLKSDFEKLKKYKSNLTLKEIKDSGHWLHFEQPRLFIQSLKDFFIS